MATTDETDATTALGVTAAADVSTAASVNTVTGIDTQIQMAIGSDVVNSLYGITGAGIKIGVISDSFNDTGGAAQDMADGALPNVNVVIEQPSGGTDEGRAMVEVAYAVAPGAQYSFAAGVGGVNGLAAAVTALQNAGDNIIVDDLGYGSSESFFQVGTPGDVAIEQAVAAGIDYFSAAGNDGENWIQQGFTPLSVTIPNIGAVTANDFGGSSPYLSVTIAAGGKANVLFEWAQPFATYGAGNNSAQNSLAIYLLDSNGNVVASATTDEVGGNPSQDLSYTNNTAGTSFRVVVVQNGGVVPTGEKFEIEFEEGSSVTINSAAANMGSGNLLGHELIPGANAVSAVPYTSTPANGVSPPVIEPFSSDGPGQLLFDANGNPITPVTVNEPVFSAPDGTNTETSNTNNGFAPFFGTSAASPAAAATSALVLQADPTLTTVQVTSLLRQATLPVITNGFEGTGLIQARAAVEIGAADAGDRWSNAAGGDWNTAANWSTGAAPTTAMAAGLGDNLGAFTGNYTVTVDTAGDAAGSLAISAPAGSSAALNVTTAGILTIGPAGATNTAPTATDVTSGDLLVSDNGTLKVTGGTITETGSLNVNNGTVIVSLGSVTANNYAENAGLLTVGGGGAAAGLTLTGLGFVQTGGMASITSLGTLATTVATITAGSLSVLAGGTITTGLLTDAATITDAGKIVDTGALANGTANSLGGLITLQSGGELDIGGTTSFTNLVFSGQALLGLSSSSPDALINGSFIDISGFKTPGDAIDFTGFTYDQGDTETYTASTGSTGDLKVFSSTGSEIADITFATADNYNSSSFRLTADASNHEEVVAACYCPGTLILTSSGEVPVEDLEIGDFVETADGKWEPIRWIGRRSYAGAYITDRQLMLPVCFKKDSLADGVPHTDLWVSPGHAMFVDGQLVPAWRLVNGSSIGQAKAVDQVTYIHVELERHAILLANGAAAESFLDDDCRGQFHNAAQFYADYPDAAPMTPLAPRLEDGFALHRLHKRLAARAGVTIARIKPGPLRGFVDIATPNRVSGWAQDTAYPERPIGLEVLIDGRPVLSLLANAYRADLHVAGMGSGCHAFDMALPEGLSGSVSVRRRSDRAPLALTSAAVALAGDQRHAA